MPVYTGCSALILLIPMLKIQAERLAVMYPDGRFAYTCSAETARQLLRGGTARPLDGNKRHIRTLQLVTGPSRPVAGTKYSHNRENKQRGPYAGVQNVWTLRRLDDGTSEGIAFAARVFRAVQLDCMA